MCRLKNVSMLHMLRVLEYGFGFDLSQFDFLEFYDHATELPYCLLFRLAGQHRMHMHILRIPRHADENGFFRIEVAMDSLGTSPEFLIDWRMLNVSWFDTTFPTYDLFEVEV